uniref:Uncharacterized protein n=1 Tax=Romanomermis culicivorax TaxID=13658 RepID=A0A915K115_ROMCU
MDLNAIVHTRMIDEQQLEWENALLIQMMLFNGGKCGVNLGFKMVAEAGGDAVELMNIFSGQKFQMTKENFGSLFDKIMDIDREINSELSHLDRKLNALSLK